MGDLSFAIIVYMTERPQRYDVANRLLWEANRIPPVDAALRGRAKWMIDTVDLVEEMAPEVLEATDEGVVEYGSDKESIKGKHVLFVGAGKGHEMEAVLNEFPGVKATGLDPHDYFGPPVERRLKEAGHDVQYLHETIHAGELKGIKDKSVDAITLFFVLHHVDPSEYAGVLSELRRVLKDNGKVFVAEDLADSPAEAKLVEWEDRKANFEILNRGSHTYKSTEGWKLFFEKEGFVMNRVREVKPGKVRHGFFVLVRAPAN